MLLSVMLSLVLAWAVGAVDENAPDIGPDIAPDEGPSAIVEAADAQMCYRAPGKRGALDAGANHDSVTLLSSGATLGTPPDTGIAVLQAGHGVLDGSGSLKKFSATMDAAGHLQAGALLWDAGAMLTGDPVSNPPQLPEPTADLRHIFTLRHNADQSTSTIALRWMALGPQQRAALDRAAPLAAADGLGQRRLDFLRGDRTLEVGQPGGIFRRRSSVLGDVIQGAPLQVGAPSAGIYGADYADFFERHAQRAAALYFAANDGMLHAFDASDGRELFAYVPNLLLPVLSALSSTAPQQPYVGGAASAIEASVNGVWKTILVAGLGGGARGIYALDISAPDQFERGSGALWEFGSADDAAIGHVSDAPLIAKFRTAAVHGVAAYRYFAVLPGGLNAQAGLLGTNALFLLALDKSPTAPWQLGVNYYKLSTPLSAGMAGSALGPPALALGPDGTVRSAYAGDVAGNLWRFDFSTSSAGSPDIDLLFVARDATGLRQPVTQRPSVTFAPGGGYLILFGTGKLLEASDSDAANFKPQSFYAIRDAANPVPGSKGNSAANSKAKPVALVSGRAALAARTLRGSIDGAAGFAVDAADASLKDALAGWYLDFPHAASSGERSISSAVLAAGKVFFNTVLPGSAPCSIAALRSYGIDVLFGLAFDANGVTHSGSVTGQLATDTVGGTPLLVLGNVDVGRKNGIGARAVTTYYRIFNGANAAGAVMLTMPAGRIGWREIPNWPELHQAAS
ncbi:MAG: type IV pilus assembly protein PilY1, partial [Janthinobacterium sp.]